MKKSFVGSWAGLIIVTALLYWLLHALDFPAPGLFAGMAAAIVWSVAGMAPSGTPKELLIGAQIGIGLTIGALLSPEVLAMVWEHALLVIGASMATLLICIVAGWLYSLHPHVDRVTAVMSLMAGGASGLTSIADELGADRTKVAVVQYLRLLTVSASIPLVVFFVLREPRATAHLDSQAAPVTPTSVFVCVAIGAVGFCALKVCRFPAAALVGPMAAMAVLHATDTGSVLGVPEIASTACYVIIGWHVGIGLSISEIRSIVKLLPCAVFLIVISSAACLGVGIVLASQIGTAIGTGYLATTPGGVYAVLAFGAASGPEAGIIAATQIFRMVLMLIVAPIIAHLLSRIEGPSQFRAKVRPL